MTNREKLLKMSFIDMLMWLDICAGRAGFTLARCRKYKGKCYECRAAWLNEQSMSDEDENNS